MISKISTWWNEAGETSKNANALKEGQMDLATFVGLPFSEEKRSKAPPSSAVQSSGTKYKM